MYFLKGGLQAMHIFAHMANYVLLSIRPCKKPCGYVNDVKQLKLIDNAYHVSKFHILTDLSVEQVATSGLRMQTSRPVTWSE